MYDNLIGVVETEPEETKEPMNYSEEKTFIPEYQELYLQNNDMVGWIKVEDTKINYPVIVKRQFLALLNIGCEILGSLRIDELIIFEAFRTVRINHGFEHGNYFIGLSVGQRIKGYCFVLFPKALVLEFHKTGEHRAVVHMMTVDDDIVAWQLHIAVFLNIRTAVVGVCLIKAVLQIEVRVVL